MEMNKTLRIIMIVTVSTLAMILTPVNSKCVPLGDSFVASSLIPVFPPSDSDSPAMSPENRADYISPANPPVEIDADSPAYLDTDVPAASPDALTDSIFPANSPAEMNTNSPASPESPADSSSPTNLKENPGTDPSTNSPSGTKDLKEPMLSPEIKKICGKTDHPPLCESSVTPLLTPQLKPDTTSVLILAIQASINATKSAMVTVDKVAADECKEMYDDAVANLEDAIKAVKARDNPTVNTNLSAAMTDYGTCNDGFEESGEPNPLADVGGKLTKMVSNCLAISTLIK